MSEVSLNLDPDEITELKSLYDRLTDGQKSTLAASLAEEGSQIGTSLTKHLNRSHDR